MPTLKRGAADSQQRLRDARQFSRVSLQSWTNVRGRPKRTKVGSRQTNGGRLGVLSSCGEHPKWASPNLGHSCSSETKSYQIRALVDLSLFTIALRIGISSEDKGKYCLWRRRGVFFLEPDWLSGLFHIKTILHTSPIWKLRHQPAARLLPV